MKSLLLVLMGLLLIGSAANGAEIMSGHATGPGNRAAWNQDRTPFSITQNVAPGQFTACALTCGHTFEGWALRRFPLASYGFVTPINVSSVDWGVCHFDALLDSVPEFYAVQIILYSIAESSPLLFENLNEIRGVSVPLTTGDNPVPPALVVAKHTPIDGTIDPVGHDLVVAIHYPSTYGMIPQTRFAPSANSLGESAESYVAFQDCGRPEPVTPGSLGHPEAQLVLVVNGDTADPPPVGACCNALGTCTITTAPECVGTWFSAVTCTPSPCSPVPAEIRSWGQIKSTYR